MNKFNDLEGLRFGRLFVRKRDQNKGTGRKARACWLCICDCGSITSVRADRLAGNTTRSCGCLLREAGKAKLKKLHARGGRCNPMAAKNRVKRYYLTGVRRRGLVFNLTDEQFYSILVKNCYYCGDVPQQVSSTKGGSLFVHSGIDRLDSSEGYTMENSVPCCYPCNLMKLNMSYNDFITRIVKIHEYLGGSHD